MKILLTGSSSGVGRALHHLLKDEYDVHCLTRTDLDLSKVDNVINYQVSVYDMVIHCAGTGTGGKLPFANHDTKAVKDIVTTNLLAPVLLTNKLLKENSNCKVVCITSTNNKHYYANDLAYSLSKVALSTFLKMLTIDHPQLNYLEIQLGLTRTEFNNNRYKYEDDRFVDVYQYPHLDVDYVAKEIQQVLFNHNIKFIEISP
jgi:short-subunit dehydrogenase